MSYEHRAVSRSECCPPSLSPVIAGSANPKMTRTTIMMKLGQIWLRLGLDTSTITLMIKGSIPPIVGVAMYQAQPFTDIFSTLNTLVPIIALCCPYTMPKAQFLQALWLNLIFTVLACAMSFLGAYTCIRARLMSEDTPASDHYNSSASAVCAIFLFFNIYTINAMRAAIPSMLYPSICYSTFIGIIFTSIHLYPIMYTSTWLIWKLAVSYLFGFALALAVALLVFPLSNRSMAFVQEAKFLGAIRLVEPPRHALANQLRGNAVQPSDLLGKFILLHANVSSAQHDFAWGKLDGPDLECMVHLLREVLIPSLGLATIDKLFLTLYTDRRGEDAGVDCLAADLSNEGIIKDEVIRTLEISLQALSYAVNNGLDHTAYVLGLTPPSKLKDPSSEIGIDTMSSNVSPGQLGFAARLKRSLKEFQDGRQQRLSAFLESRSSRLSSTGNQSSDDSKGLQSSSQTLDQKQLYVVLHIEHLLYCHGNAVLKLVQFADSKLADGTMAKVRFISPPRFHLQNWYLYDHGIQDFGLDRKGLKGTTGQQSSSVTSLIMPTDRDVEHLSPTNTWERQSNHIRSISRFLRSPASVFGFRVACACQCVGIVAFLKHSHHFFTEQRLSWSFLIIALSSSWTSGQSAFSLVMRFVRTTF